jgi:hypothetical protein
MTRITPMYVLADLSKSEPNKFGRSLSITGCKTIMAADEKAVDIHGYPRKLPKKRPRQRLITLARIMSLHTKLREIGVENVFMSWKILSNII